MREEPKWMLTSKTIAGIIVAAAGLILNEADVAVIENATNSIVQLLPEIVQMGGLLWAAYGRFRAKQPLKMTPGA